MIERLVCNAINHSKIKGVKARYNLLNDFVIEYYLKIPASTNDKDLIKDDSMCIKYITKTKNHFVVTKDMIDSNIGYPELSNHKFLIIKRIHKFEDLVKSNYDFMSKIRQEKQSLLKEIKANILLEKIGYLTAKWQDIIDDKYTMSKIPYAKTKFDPSMDLIYNKKTKEVEYPF